MGAAGQYGNKRPKSYKVEAKVRDGNQRWTPDELRTVRTAVASGCTLQQCHALFPYRTLHSVKDQFYRCRSPQDREVPPSLSDARRQKDGREGCRALLEALMEYHPELFETARAG